MENSFQTSFIPKKPLAPAPSGVKSYRPPTSIFTAISFFILIIVIGMSVGFYFYKNYLIKTEESLSLSLERVKDTFEKDTINELELYDKRSSAAKKVLDQHIVLSPIFSLLGAITIPQVQYVSFNHETSSQGFQVSLSGVALDYKSISLQADAFNSAKGRSFRNVIFSGINKTKDNNVTFNLSFTVDPSVLAYNKNLLLEQSEPKVQAPTEGDTNITPQPIENKPQ